MRELWLDLLLLFLCRMGSRHHSSCVSNHFSRIYWRDSIRWDPQNTYVCGLRELLQRFIWCLHACTTSTLLHLEGEANWWYIVRKQLIQTNRVRIYYTCCVAAIAWEAAAAITELPELLWPNVAEIGAVTANEADGIAWEAAGVSPYHVFSSVGRLAALLCLFIWVALNILIGRFNEFSLYYCVSVFQVQYPAWRLPSLSRSRSAAREWEVTWRFSFCEWDPLCMSSSSDPIVNIETQNIYNLKGLEKHRLHTLLQHFGDSPIISFQLHFELMKLLVKTT